MLLIKKIFLGLLALGLIFVGGNGTQSVNVMLQGGGFVAIIIGLVVLYIFGKLIWKAMGCLPSLLILIGIVAFVLYAIGAFNGGVENVIPNLQNFFGQSGVNIDDDEPDDSNDDIAPPTSELKISENFSSELVGNARISENTATPQPTAENSRPVASQQSAAVDTQLQKPIQTEGTRTPETQSDGNGIMGFINNLVGSNKNTVQEPKNFNPNNYPAVYGTVQIANGDTFVMRRHYIRLYGIDAPELNQKCADSQGRTYACGREAALWLQEWIGDNEIECHVIKQDRKGNVVGTCSFGQYDIGAALVAAGWAVALPNSAIYQPYELQAQKGRRGMWQGQFYKPWDWVKIQSRKPKIKVVKPKNKKRLWDFM